MTIDAETREPFVPTQTIVELAALCENVLIEGLGTLSLIRVINRIYPASLEDQSLHKELKFVATLIEGTDENPPHRIQVNLRFPDGQQIEGDEHEFEFPPSVVHMTHAYTIPFGTDQVGLHTFEVIVNERLSKRVFLQSIIPAKVDTFDPEEFEANQQAFGNASF